MPCRSQSVSSIVLCEMSFLIFTMDDEMWLTRRVLPISVYEQQNKSISNHYERQNNKIKLYAQILDDICGSQKLKIVSNNYDDYHYYYLLFGIRSTMIGASLYMYLYLFCFFLLQITWRGFTWMAFRFKMHNTLRSTKCVMIKFILNYQNSLHVVTYFTRCSPSSRHENHSNVTIKID